eukprot:TRINITY_DN2230_c0_g1_i3.p1 TRINITY_DN2230_c0_g1~~TRINITY_DN2230_c0_g1_i3.p1  ORF type:complete len:350 (-),score=-21.90 TRINITY_DN2230_c0_g1_i3:106-1065(-)
MNNKSPYENLSFTSSEEVHLHSTISVKQLNCFKRNKDIHFRIYQGPADSFGDELYTAIDHYPDRGSACLGLPKELSFFSGHRLVGKLSRDSSQRGCSKSTLHRLTLGGSDGLPVSEIIMDFSCCRGEVTVNAGPFFSPRRIRPNFIPSLLCFAALILGLTTAMCIMAQKSRITTIVIAFLVWFSIAGMILYALHNREALYCYPRRQKLLELNNYHDGSVSAIIYKVTCKERTCWQYNTTCIRTLFYPEYEVELMEPVDTPKLFTILSVVMRLNWVLQRNEAQQLFNQCILLTQQIQIQYVCQVFIVVQELLIAVICYIY